MRESFDDENEDLGFSPINKYEQMIADQSNAYFDVEEMEEIIEYYIEQESLEKALEASEFGLAQHPNEASLLILKSEIHLEKDQSKKALESLQMAIAHNPCNPEVYSAMGGVYARLKSPREAIYYYEKSLEYYDNEEREEVLFDIAFEYQNLRQFGDAMKYLKEVLENNPQNETAMFEIGLCYSEMNLDGEAVDYFSKYLDEYPYSYIGWFNLANSYMKQGNYDLAIFAFDYSAIINEFFPAAYYGKANGFIQKGEYEKAIVVLNETFGLEQPHSFVYCTIGECYEKMNDLDKALSFYEKAIEIDYGYPDAWIGLAVVYKMKKDYEKALKHINKATQVSASNIDTLSIKAEILEEMGSFEGALEIYQDILKDYPNEEDTHYNLGSLLADLKRYDEAIDALEIGYERTKSAEIFFKMTAVAFDSENQRLGMSLLEKGVDRHKGALKKFYDFYPTFRDNKEIVALLIEELGDDFDSK
jgi:tetratricopeptide (TPR) repeat protein